MKSAKSSSPLRGVPFGFVAGAVVLACVVVLCARGAAGQTPSPKTQSGPVDWIIVVDTSASMRGVGGTKNIFGKVKTSVADFARNARSGDTVTIYTFDSDTHVRPTVRVEDETDIRDLLATVKELEANGNRTHTGKAVRDALVRAGELARRSDAANRTPSIVLFTDGVEDVTGIPNPVSIPSNVQLIPNSQPYLFFVSLGEREHERKLEEFVKDPAFKGRGEVVRDPGAAQLEELSGRIRKQVEETPPATPTPTPTPTPPPTPVEVSLRVQPSQLDFGEIEPGERTARQEIKLTSNAATRVRISLKGSGSSPIRIEEPEGGALDLKANEETEVKLRLAADANADDGVRDLQLILRPEPPTADAVVTPSVITARLNVATVPLWRKLLKWFAILLLLLLLAVVAYSLYKGKPPWDFVSDIKGRKWLDGELELIRPAPPRSEDAFVGLGQLETDRALISPLFPDVTTNGADAELSTELKGGTKRVILRRTEGVVRLNGAEVALVPIYDGDIIELDSVRLRFNRLGHERPVEENL